MNSCQRPRPGRGLRWVAVRYVAVDLGIGPRSTASTLVEACHAPLRPTLRAGVGVVKVVAVEDLAETRPTGNALSRLVWLVLGLMAVGLGGLGVVVPGLPTTGFFILAAWCFSRSSPRLERWVLGLPGVGRMVADHRAGLGMPRSAKAVAITMMVAAGTASVVWALDGTVARTVVAAAVVVGVWYVARRVPTREAVLAHRSPTPPEPTP